MNVVLKLFLADLLNIILSPNVAHSFSVIPKTPVVCSIPKEPLIYRLNSTIDCDTVSQKSSTRYHQNATLYKLNLSKFHTRAWSCQKVRRIDVFYKGFGPIYKLNQKLIYLHTTADECRQMIESKTCKNGEGIQKLYQRNNDLWSTNLSSTVYVKTFQIKSYNVTNCFLSMGSVWINRFMNKLESNFGSVNHCSYLDGFCNVTDNVVSIWHPKPRAKCLYTPWKSVEGFFDNNVWFSTEGEPIALTFGNNLTKIVEECGHTFYKTDQGIGISIQDIRRKRNVEDFGGYNPVTQSEVNMKLQGIVRGILSSPDVNGLAASCAVAQEIAHSWHDEFTVNPTMVARRILRNPLIKAEIRGRALAMWSCSLVESYAVLPMGDFCTNYLPIIFNVSTSENVIEEFFGYMDPSTNEIHSTTTKVKCNQMESVFIELNKTVFKYNYKVGAMSIDNNLPSFPTYFAPSIDVSRNNTNTLLSSIIYKTGSMYNRSEYMHFIDTNVFYRFINQEKLKRNMFTPILNIKDSGVSFTLPDIKRTFSDFFSGATSSWSIFYWFAVAIIVIVIACVSCKLIRIVCCLKTCGK